MVDRIGRGVVMFVWDTILCKRCLDLEVRGVQKQLVGTTNLLVGKKLRTTKQTFRLFNLLKESIDRAGSTDTVDIIITGDFNFNMTHHTPKKMNELMAEYTPASLYQTIHTSQSTPHLLWI